VEIASWQELQMQALMGARSEEAFFKVLTGAARELGFDYCAFGMRAPLPLSNPKTLVLSNYDPAWQERYARENYVAIDPTVAHGLRSVQPLVWNESLFELNRPFWEEAKAHGIQVGWAQSTYDARGVASMLTLARSEEALTRAELAQNELRMSWLVQAAHEAMATLQAARRAPEPEITLTAREIEVLRWTADGKTSSEVGEIMNISERTVNFHVNNALEKLGAANKTAGVVKAAMLRLL